MLGNICNYAISEKQLRPSWRGAVHFSGRGSQVTNTLNTQTPSGVQSN